MDIAVRVGDMAKRVNFSIGSTYMLKWYYEEAKGVETALHLHAVLER